MNKTELHQKLVEAQKTLREIVNGVFDCGEISHEQKVGMYHEINNAQICVSNASSKLFNTGVRKDTL